MTEATGLSGDRQGRVVAGVDGSAGSLHAALVAAWEATARNARLELVAVARIPMTADGFGAAEAFSAAEAEARRAVEKAAQAVRGAYPHLEPELAVRSGSAIPGELLEAAEGAELLVVGTRGHGGFAGLLLGSVSSQVVHHPPCPVMVVPPLSSDGTEAGSPVETSATR